MSIGSSDNVINRKPQVIDYEPYYQLLKEDTDELYDLVNVCRSQGHDPELVCEIPQANDLADRTQQLLEFLHTRNTAQHIRELTVHHKGNRELVALDIARIVAAETYLYGESTKCSACDGSGTMKVGYRKKDCKDCSGAGLLINYKNKIKENSWQETLKEFEEIPPTYRNQIAKTRMALCIYHGVCAGLAVLTEGILVAPLEGVVNCRIISNDDGSRSLAINYAGPIRSAGGTGQALSVLIGDILRRDFGLVPPQITWNEVERYKEEVSKYSRGLQYRPSNPQLEVIAQNCPVYIDGEGVGDEVSGQRDLPRVPTNKVREGMLLVMCEGLVLKAPKILKYTDELGFKEWEWLRDFVSGSTDDDEKITELKPIKKFLADMVAGRPIFSQPMRPGGFRLRYGRSRLAGLATTAVHPATMKVVNGFFITGTQLKYERPGKGTVVTPCSSIEGPYVEFQDGSARRIQDPEMLPDGLATDPEWPIKKIWDLGELLVPVGEFIENNHVLPPSPYVTEWHTQLGGAETVASVEAAFEEVRNSKIPGSGLPLHPSLFGFYSECSGEELENLKKITTVDSTGEFPELVRVIDEDPNRAGMELVYRLGFDVDSEGVLTCLKGSFWGWLVKNGVEVVNVSEDGWKWLESTINGQFLVKPNLTLRIGARMGKPEGSKPREMKPALHSLFPVGHQVGNKRLLRDAAQKRVEVQLGSRIIPGTGQTTWKKFIRRLSDPTDPDSEVLVIPTEFKEVDEMDVDYNKLWEESLIKAEVTGSPNVKGIKGMSSIERVPEDMLKGVLRYKHGVSTFRDGTLRYDMVDITMTHFKPREIGLTVEKAIELGYDTDWMGDPLISPEQILELRVQDVVLPMNCAENLLAATQYLDELLEKLYDQDPFYNCKNISDLIGHLGMGIAPHTSGSIVCRIIGFAAIKGHYGHPFFHAAKRRNCDGDIDAFLLLLDGLLNFSKSFLPSTRGGQMDAPLILTMKINPSEIDKEALNIETVTQYPVSFYEATQDFPPAKDAVKFGVEIVESRLGSPAELSGFGFTHDSDDCAGGPADNPYTELESMKQKTMAQFALGELLYSVDNQVQASKLIDRHLIRDMRGNLRAFGQQSVRCPRCGAKYRRPPISGKCRTVLSEKSHDESMTGEDEVVICDGNLILTVSQGSVKKYNGLMVELVDRYGCDEYIEQLHNFVSLWVSQTFDDQDELKQTKLF